MSLAAEDRMLIHELINLHGHLCDYGEFERFGEVFSDDVAYDLEELGYGTLIGLKAVREAAMALGDRNPVAHHVTNIVLTDAADGRIEAMSKGLGIGSDGSVGSVVYEDTLVRLPRGWRIVRRKLRPRKRPLHK